MKRSKHSLSHFNLLTCNMGELVPIGVCEVLPGDTFQHATSALIRVSPLNSPVMHPVHVRIHHWFVPNRLVWDGWEDFITGGPDGNNSDEVPQLETPASTGFTEGSLADYFGIEPGVASYAVNALPFRGYSMIWNEWYRDQDLQTALTVDTGDGPDTTTNTALQNVCWQKDYFTTSRPWAQKGPAVSLPLGTTAPVERTPNAGPWVAYNQGTNTLSGASAWELDTNSQPVKPGINALSLDPDGGLFTDLTNATAATINQLRASMAIQRYEEARARYGSRYTEYLRYLGIRSSDARLQRPEYLGGGKQTIQFSEVLQTGVTTSGNDDGVGNLKGHGIGAMRSNRYRRFFEEHGYVFSLMSVKPITMYVQGLDRTWSRSTKLTYFQKELAHIGQQEIENSEVKMSHASPTDTFGYQDRYDEYRRMRSRVAGEFRSTLDYWHMGRIFSSDPALNSTFVSSNPTDRIYQSTATDQLQVMVQHSIQARRIIPARGTPLSF